MASYGNTEVYRRRISPKELREKGWAALGGRTYKHSSGWLIEWCGHPTALWPYGLYSPEGRMVLAPNGRAWVTVAYAVDYVTAELERAGVEIKRAAEERWAEARQLSLFAGAA